MESNKMEAIVRSIVQSVLGNSVAADISLRDVLAGPEQFQELAEALNEELSVVIARSELEASNSLLELANLVQSRLARDPKGRTLMDIYKTLEQVARDELHPRIDYHWYACWDSFFKTGNWLTAPEPYDTVEMVMRLEDLFGFKISDQEAQSLKTVGQTVKYLWLRSSSER